MTPLIILMPSPTQPDIIEGFEPGIISKSAVGEGTYEAKNPGVFSVG